MKVVERIVPLSDCDSLYTKLCIEHGCVMDFVVVQKSCIGGSWHQIVRYDCSHGAPHKDCLYEARLRKEALADKPMDTLWAMAKDEVKREWKNYKSRYAKNHLR